MVAEVHFMDEANLEQLSHINYAKGLERFMGNAKMYHEYLNQFLYDGSFEEFFAGITINDSCMARKALHTLKGTAANLSLEKLYYATKEMSKAMEESQTDETTSALADSICKIYGETCDAVREYI